jgi:peptidoglycan/xylan/chitin deacetylase (PgdA/CDA1 family)
MIDSGDALRRLTLNVVRFSGAAALARMLVGGIGAVLMLHRVTAHLQRPNGVNRHLAVAPAFLDLLIADMKKAGYDFVSLDEAIDRIVNDPYRRRFATITADDAYRDNLTEALPIFEKHGTPFAVYVAPSLINGATDLWWELVEDIIAAQDFIDVPTPRGRVRLDCSTPAKKHAANIFLHDHLVRDVAEEDQRTVVRELARSVGVDFERPRRETLMSWEEVRTIAAHPLATIGAHTVNHYNLKRLSEEKAFQEMADAARILELELGERPRHMAYPYGYAAAVCEREVRLAKEAGFVSAVTTRHGVLRAEHARHLHALPRISVNGRYQSLPHLRTMLSGVTTPLANAGKLVVTV